MRAMDVRARRCAGRRSRRRPRRVGWGSARSGCRRSYLFGALLTGVAAALLAPDRLAIPPSVFTAALAVAGVVLGTLLDSSSLDAIADGWLPLALVTAATLAISLAAGVLLARATPLDLPTAALGMVAGGASGIVGISGELGADDRLVAFMQYLRVLVIVLLTPVLVAIAFPGRCRRRRARSRSRCSAMPRGWLLMLAARRGRRCAGRRLRLPGASLIVPMAIAAVVSLAVPGGEFEVPPLAREVAFSLIGLQVGLRFTVETIRLLGRLLLPVLVALFGVLAACALLARRCSTSPRRVVPRRLPRHDAGRAVRGPGRRARRERERRVHPRGAGPAADRDGRARASGRALDGGARGFGASSGRVPRLTARVTSRG